MNKATDTPSPGPQRLRARRAWLKGTLLGTLTLSLALLTSCGSGDSAKSGSAIPELLVVTPHGADILREFGNAFAAWHQQKYGTPVKVRWPDIGGNGTGNIMKALSAEYATKPSSGYDIIWGGGSATFNDFDRNGYLEKPDIAAETLAAVPATIFGTPLHGPDNRWIAATMSNFGIVVNIDRTAELGLATPKKWEDIAAPEWFGNLSLGDPSKSGSVRSAYEMILQQYGWEKGWQLLTLMFANAGTIRDVSSTPAEDVGSAQEIAGIVIDFFGRKQIIRVGPKIVAFIVPEGGSTIDPDPIAMLRGAPHRELAAHFIEFVISPEGQKLWVFKPGTPGGPAHSGLGRMTMLPQIYKDDAQYLSDKTDPFNSAAPLHLNVPALAARTVYIGDLIKAAIIDNRFALVAARAAIKAAGDPPELLAKLSMLPTFTPTTVNDAGALIDGKSQPITGDIDVQKTVADEFKPHSDKKKVYAERLQARLKDGWRTEFAQHFASVAAEAQNLKK